MKLFYDTIETVHLQRISAMNLKIHKTKNHNIAELVSDTVEISTVQDALDVMANADYLGARSIIVHEKNLNPDFFDLKTRFAGEVVQKFVNYHVRLAIIGDFSKYASKSLKDFIRESNRTGRILFLTSVDEAILRMDA